MGSMNVYLDTETTGLVGSRLIELCYWVEDAPAPVVLRCKPPVAIELDAMVVHGITEADVAMLLPFKEQACYQEIKELLEHPDTVVVAHNASFDIGVLEREGIVVKKSICTKELAKKKWPKAPKHRLQHLRYWLDIIVPVSSPAVTAHSALGDVLVLRALWDKLR